MLKRPLDIAIQKCIKEKVGWIGLGSIESAPHPPHAEGSSFPPTLSKNCTARLFPVKDTDLMALFSESVGKIVSVSLDSSQ